MRRIDQIKYYVLVGVIFLLLGGCSPNPSAEGDDRLQVLATTSVVADIVDQVGSEYIHVDTLLPLGADPHSFTPTPKDVSRLAEADLVFINGAGLEEFLAPMIESAGVETLIVDLSADVPLRSLDADHHVSEAEHTGADPHTWMDPNNVGIWAQVIAHALASADPSNASVYQSNAERLQSDLSELDNWIKEQVSQLPLASRELVTDHMIFGYFADRYGFTQVGAIIPGFSTLSEPSAQELAQLEATISQLDVPVIFVGWTGNRDLANRIADDTGIRIVPLFTSSLSETGGGAASYQDFIRYDVNAIVSALK